MRNESKRTSKDSAVAQYNLLLSRNLSEETEENHDKPFVERFQGRFTKTNISSDVRTTLIYH